MKTEDLWSEKEQSSLPTYTSRFYEEDFDPEESRSRFRIVKNARGC